MTAVPSARRRAATTVKGMSSSDDLARALGVDTEQVCRAILADARVLKAVRGGLTEHLGQQMLAAIPGVVQVVRSERGGAWDVELGDDTRVRVSVHSADTSTYADGTAKVDLRRSAPLNGQRLYLVDDVDVLAVSLVAVTGAWDWRFARPADLATKTVDGVAYLDPNCRIDERWCADLDQCLAAAAQPADQLALFG